MKCFLLTAIITLVFSLQVCFSEEPAAPVTQTNLIVEVTNGTANGSSVAGDEVTLQIYQHGQLLRTFNSKIADNGKAVFDDVTIGEHNIAIARVMHQNMSFSGHSVVLKQTQNTVSTNVQVFDVSDDKSQLAVKTHHLIIKVQSDFLVITEYMQLKNSSDMAVTSKQKDDQSRPVVLEIMLPEGFENLKSSSYFEDNALVITEYGFYDTMAVPPGEYAVSFSYTININADTMDFVKKLSLPTSSLVIFAELGQAKIQGLGQAYKLTGANGVPMEYYKRSNLAPAEDIVFQIAGFNVNTPATGTWVILSVVLGAVVILALLRLRSEKN